MSLMEEYIRTGDDEEARTRGRISDDGYILKPHEDLKEYSTKSPS